MKIASFLNRFLDEFKAVYDLYGEEVLKHGITDDKEGNLNFEALNISP